MRALILSMALFAIACGTGCQTDGDQRAWRNQPPSMIVVGDAEPAASGEIVDDVGAAWSFARNDDRLGSTMPGHAPAVLFVEVRQRDFQRTINGRPREYSTTTTRSIMRGVYR